MSLLEQYGIPGQEQDKQEGKHKQEEARGTDRRENTEKQGNTRQEDTQKTMRNSQKKTPQEGATVKHAAHGIGVITYIKGPYMGVSFKSAGDKKYRYPDAFEKGFLTLI